MTGAELINVIIRQNSKLFDYKLIIFNQSCIFLIGLANESGINAMLHASPNNLSMNDS